MGTGRPHVEITAATLAGGERNQDRYAYGDGWAFVLDGASSFAKTQPEHDGGWYAEHLKQALSTGLMDHPERPTPEIVEGAIRAVAKAHGGDAASCPTSTIALVRWSPDSMETYVLGDSTVVLISPDDERVLSDHRLARIGQTVRDEYRSRMSAGHGFDDHHRRLLRELQSQQSAARNQADGYWIAGAEPEAAHQGLRHTRRIANLRAVLLATDGAALGLRYGVFPTWTAVAGRDHHEALEQIHAVEQLDPQAATWPRSKLHDDKTLLGLHFR